MSFHIYSQSLRTKWQLLNDHLKWQGREWDNGPHKMFTGNTAKGEMAKALKSRLSAAILCQEICTDHSECDVHINNKCTRCLFQTTSEKSNTTRALAIWKKPQFKWLPELEAEKPPYSSREYHQTYHIPKFTRMSVLERPTSLSSVLWLHKLRLQEMLAFPFIVYKYSRQLWILRLQQKVSLPLHLLSTMIICRY